MSDFENVPVNDLPADAVILDVREDYEWVAGHAEGALHIPLDQLPSRLDDLDPDQDLYVICRTGGRSFTMEPLPCRVSTRPLARTSTMAFRMVPPETP